jgi:molecular chaperone GrpE
VSRESRTHFQSDHPHEQDAELGQGGGRATGGGAGAGGEPRNDPPSAAGAPGGDNGRGDAQVEALRRELATAEQNAQAQRDLYLRSAAELENVRKRAQRDIEQAHRYAIEGFASELLPVRDSLELGLSSGASADAKTLLAGQEATLKLLQRAFDKFAIRQIDPVGQPFDPNQHEAVLMQESSSSAPNSVLQVVQSGYDLNGRLLRPARVIVARPSGGRSDGGG